MSSTGPKKTVLLYYKYVPISDTAAFREAHYEKCRSLNLKGRIYIAQEGINGTVSGDSADTQAYKEYVESLPGFAGIHWKEASHDEIPFAKLKVKIRPFLINFGIGNQVDPRKGGRHLEPQEWKQVMEQEKDYVILDVRNSYESEVGHFENAIRPNVEAFSDFPKWVQELVPYKDKKVLMYCTGGIRCEKFSAYLVKEGFKDVSQLKGGILNYIKQVGTNHWKGRCFVFDDRLSTDCGTPQEPLAHCQHCQRPEDRHINCSNMTCNKLFIVCDDCAHKYLGACSTECRDAPGRRPFDAQTFRIPFRKKGVVFRELGLAESTRQKLGIQKPSWT